MKVWVSIFGGFVTVFLLWGILVLVMPYDRIVSSHENETSLVIPEQSDVWEIAGILKQEGFISNRMSFVFGVWRDGLRGGFHAGTFQIPPRLSVRDTAHFLVSDDGIAIKDIRVTFPEGWTINQMADRLNANNLPGDDVRELSQDASDFSEEFLFLSSLPNGAGLEGFLFPDTYLFDPESSAESIIGKMLTAFETKALPITESDPGSLYETIIMASIIEGEVRSSGDRRIVSGIFQKRLEIDMPLQSDATLVYVAPERKIQHNAEDLATDSPYNTYANKGLPPGPVSNPSADSIGAALSPEPSPYLYFLNDPETGKTYFAADFEVHKQNKARVGL